jgi:DNA repair protein SbcC/Rad50
MLITRLELRNIKSYQEQTITFEPGINAICGQNGAGKSTILEAIGFALFDYLPYRQDDFVREGEKTGTVTVSLVSGRDERAYQITRRCGRSAGYDVFDPAVGTAVAQNKADVVDWLREHLKLDEDDDLSELFLNAVGVPQGLLTSAFLETASKRKDIFNPLLRVDEYERAWQRLRDTESYLKDKKHAAQVRIAGLEADVARLPKQEQSATTLREAITNDTTRLEACGTELAHVTRRRDALRSIKERLAELRAQVERVAGQRAGLEQQQHNANDLVEQAAAARQVVDTTSAGHRQHEAAQAEIAQLEQQARERDTVMQQRRNTERELALAEQRKADLAKTLEAVAAAEARMHALQPDVTQQEQLEANLRAAEQDVQRWEAAQAQVKKAQERLHELATRLDTIRSEIETRTAAEQELATLDERIVTLAETISHRQAEQQHITATQPDIEQRLAILETPTDAATCPVCRQALTAAQAADLAASYRAELGHLETRLTQAQAAQTAAEQEQQQAKKQQRTLHKQVTKLATPEQQTTLEQDIQAQQAEVEQLRAQATELEQAPARVADIQQRLAAVGDPRSAYQQQQFQAAQRGDTETKLAQVQAAAVALEEQITRFAQQLQPYAGLDDALQAAKATRDATSEAYQQYLSHRSAAQRLEEHQAQAAALAEQIATLQQQEQACAAQVQATEADYSEETYVQVETAHSRLTSEQTTLNERLRLQRDNLARAEAEITALRDTQTTLEQARAEQAEQEALEQRVGFVRSTLREAGPYITRARVQSISREANLIFGEILNNYALRLAWHEDYEIAIESQGRQRTFRQLSGGEQMSAALAVRLALLKQMTGIDVAFFDEPTSNMDGERRDNLADQMMNIRGFSQLFVISHDDTFERSTQNIIRITKDNGVSQWERV